MHVVLFNQAHTFLLTDITKFYCKIVYIELNRLEIHISLKHVIFNRKNMRPNNEGDQLEKISALIFSLLDIFSGEIWRAKDLVFLNFNFFMVDIA